jgi:ABC-type bacteriocin/lantibiotic exporter with double-glycine peptidase domain
MVQGVTEAGQSVADVRGPWSYLWWLIRRQKARVATGGLIGSVWMVGLTLPPYLLCQAIDRGLRPRDPHALAGWVAALFAAGAANALLAMLRHRTVTRIRLDGGFRTVRVVNTHVTRLGAALPRHIGAGEVVTIVIADAWVLAQALTVAGPGFGAAVAYVVVAVLLQQISPLLALVVVAGAPVMALIVGPMLSRLRHADARYRAQQGALTDRLVDIIGGLRVLNGLGGKDGYLRRYRRDSGRIAAAGYRVGAVASWIQAVGAGLPALFLAVVVWLAARLAAQGRITAGELVAVWGYAAVLVVPVAFLIEGGFDVSRALVAARRVTDFLRLPVDPVPCEPGPDGPAELHDPESGVVVLPGRFTALATARKADAAAVVDRLGRYVRSSATWGGKRLDRIAVRDRILVADCEDYLFSGALGEVVAGRRPRDDEATTRALTAAAAHDIMDGLAGGTAATIDTEGRNLSGGQRQRLRLARALYADPDILLAVEPTSAVDAHTEAAIAERLPAVRARRATLVATTSPLLLDRADIVHYLVGGRLAATGTHRALLDTEPGYRALVTRGAAQSAAAETAR